MKNFIKKNIALLVNNDISWQLLKPIAKAGSYMNFIRKGTVGKRNKSRSLNFFHLFAGKEVLHGPFKGMKYASFESVGSALYPKLLGSYEKEIQPVIEECCKKSYSEIIDIGCAEGYYAVGFALKMSGAKIYAYDTDESARTLCFEMAKLNGVDKNITIRRECSPEELINFPISKRGLLICDCEGFELELFTEHTIANLKHCDLIIETHDFINIEISTRLYRLFSDSHTITTIKSADDIEKAKTYHYPETEGLSLSNKREVYEEKRPSIMEWLYCTPKAD